MRIRIAAVATALVFGACSSHEPSADAQRSPKLLLAAHPVSGQYIVVLNDGADVPSLAQELANKHGGNLLRTYQHAMRGFALKLPKAQARRAVRGPARALGRGGR